MTDALDIPATAAPGTRYPLFGYIAIPAIRLLGHCELPAYFRTQTESLGSRFEYIHTAERDPKGFIDVERINGDHYCCSPDITFFVYEVQARDLGFGLGAQVVRQGLLAQWLDCAEPNENASLCPDGDLADRAFLRKLLLHDGDLMVLIDRYATRYNNGTGRKGGPDKTAKRSVYLHVPKCPGNDVSNDDGTVSFDAETPGIV